MKVIMSSRMVFPFHGYGGMERYIYFLSKHLIEQGVEVEIITSPEHKGRTNHVEAYNGMIYNFITPMVRGARFFGFYRSYHLFNINSARYLRKKKFDILHCYEITSFPYLLFKNRATVIFQPFHRGTEPWKAKKMKEKIFNFPMDYPLRYCMTHADAIASEGEIQTKKFVEFFGIDREKIFELHDGVDLSLINSYISEGKVSREDIGLKDDDFVIINVNRIEKEKGVSYLIEALPLIRKEIENVRLIMIGKGSDEPRIYSLIHKYGLQDIVKHFRDVEDSLLFNYYSLADIFVTPTIYEGLPLVVLEAMACGLPIIATNTAENPQVVKDGKNGYLVPVADSKAIADAVLKMHDKGKIKKMSEYSKCIIKDYDWKIVAKKAIREYERLINMVR